MSKFSKKFTFNFKKPSFRTLVAAILVYLIMTETDIDCGIVCNPAPPPHPTPFLLGEGRKGGGVILPPNFQKWEA